MNAKHISLAFAVSAALIVGCAKSPIEDVNPSEPLVDLELASVSSTETKAAIDGTTFPQTGQIGLFLFKDEQATQSYGASGCENVEYSYNNGNKKWTASPPIKVGSDPGYLYGYYPYSGTATNVKAIPVSSSLNGDDVMYAAKQTAITDATASQTTITMNHALARVSITVKNNGYTGKALLTSIKFEGAKIAGSGTLDATSGNITASKADDVTLSVPDSVQTIATGNGTTYECLLVPSDKVSGPQAVDLTLTIDGVAKTAKLSGDDNGVIIAQGTKSNITITLSNTGIAVQTVSVEDWNVVEVGEHKVTVTLDGEADGIEKDVWTMAYKDEGDVKIKAFSESGRRLGCVISGEASCDTVIIDSVYTFTISDLSSDVIATVEYPKPTEISLSMPNYTACSGRSFRLRATVLPDDAYNKTCTWSSDAPSVATVDENGRVTAIAGGTAKITATTVVGGVTATCTTTVESYEPALPKEFSVGPAGNCKKVRFSRGNLNYTPGIDSWWFFDKQYETGHGADQLSLFTWGYGDWSMSKDTTAYASGDFTDWGTQVGAGNIWRTLTADEWGYLFNTEDKYGFATVCGIKGIIILPDEFEDPKTNESTDPTCVDKKFVPKSDQNEDTSNDYTSGDSWDKMQAAGALFLPSAGYRDGSTVNHGTGHYWSSSANVANTASYMNFYNTDLWPSITDLRNKGRSVRLVTEVN